MPADLVAAAAAAELAADLEAEVAHVEEVFGEGGSGNCRPSSIAVGAGSNVFEFVRFVRAGGLGTSSFDSRASASSSGGGGISIHGDDFNDDDDDDDEADDASTKS